MEDYASDSKVEKDRECVTLYNSRHGIRDGDCDMCHVRVKPCAGAAAYERAWLSISRGSFWLSNFSFILFCSVGLLSNRMLSKVTAIVTAMDRDDQQLEKSYWLFVTGLEVKTCLDLPEEADRERALLHFNVNTARISYRFWVLRNIACLVTIFCSTSVHSSTVIPVLLTPFDVASWRACSTFTII